MNQKMFEGILHATSEKRYQYFLNTVSDTQMVWMADCGDNTLLSPEIDGTIYYLAWPDEEFAGYYVEKMFPDAKFQIVSIEVHDFCNMLQLNHVMFLIFPTDNDAWIVTSDELYENLSYELSRIE